MLSDGDSGRYLGTVAVGYLFLEDERDRSEVLARLAQANIPVAPPNELTPPVGEDDWPPTAIPNMWTYWFVDGLDLRPRDPRKHQSWTSIAHYNPTTKKLWVEDSRLVAPALIYAARVGIAVAEIGLPREPWGLETEIPYFELKDHALRPDDRHQTLFNVELLEGVRGLVPNDLLSESAVEWIPSASALSEPDASFLLHEPHVRQRGTLFGDHALTSVVRACRLCGQPGLELTTPICREALTYCHACLENADRGVIKDRGRAAQALRLLGQLEFGGTPMLEDQLNTLHVNPVEPIRGEDIDQLLLLRFTIARGQYPWVYLLEEAGFAEGGLRSGRGTLIRARDGHLCLSLLEKTVCDFLHLHNIAHQREPLYPVDMDLNPRGLRRADWLLADGTLVEMWGMPNQRPYAEKMAEKRQLAARHGLSLIELTDSDLVRLPEVFTPWLPLDIAQTTSWSWSPILTSAKPPEREPRGDSRGRNEANAAARNARLERCARAVTMQAAGLSRTAIAEELGVGPDAAKGLLRDGKFYADPATDPDRLRVAHGAAQAQDRGLTRAQFQAVEPLSTPQLQEAWRDADVLREVLLRPPAPPPCPPAPLSAD